MRVYTCVCVCVRVCVCGGRVRVHNATYVLQACSVAPQRVLLQRAAPTYVSVRLCGTAHIYTDIHHFVQGSSSSVGNVHKRRVLYSSVYSEFVHNRGFELPALPTQCQPAFIAVWSDEFENKGTRFAMGNKGTAHANANDILSDSAQIGNPEPPLEITL